jgi:predicted transposase YbfD/YdcC
MEVEASGCDFPGVEVVLWERRRSVGKKKWENRYFIASKKREPGNQKTYARVIREHWGIESRLHWRKDAILREDDTRCRDPKTVSNLMLLRNLVIHFYEHTQKGENLPAWVQVNQRSNRQLCRWMTRKSWGK